ncbi:MAG: hypothetical protein K8I30_14750 [Anaerolineae bacterium]|nr:hypothetical protein [Anaerolineae bacterium]
MSRFPSIYIRLYSNLLRLYPARFRADFADEMVEVFRLKLESAHSPSRPLMMLLTELRDLPVGVLQEHLRERRKRILATNTGVIVMESGRSIQVFRIFSISLFVVLAVFALMVVVPFFWLGLYGQTEMEVISGSLGPEAFPLYGGQPNVLPGIAVLMMFAAPVWNMIFGGGVLLMLGMFWRRLSPRQRRLGLLAVLVAITPTLFMLLPVGRIVFSWWMN